MDGVCESEGAGDCERRSMLGARLLGARPGGPTPGHGGSAAAATRCGRVGLPACSALAVAVGALVVVLHARGTADPAPLGSEQKAWRRQMGFDQRATARVGHLRLARRKLPAGAVPQPSKGAGQDGGMANATTENASQQAGFPTALEAPASQCGDVPRPDRCAAPRACAAFGSAAQGAGTCACDTRALRDALTCARLCLCLDGAPAPS